jgi:SNF2 family DNA or RNA helicase
MPLPHQKEAIGWLLAHAERSIKLNGASRKALGGGFLLADDMGLGKSFSVLVFLAEWQARRRQLGGEPMATLIVAPVTLIENWRSELAKSYTQPDRIFKRVVHAYPEGELMRYRTDTGDVADPGEGDPLTRMKSWGLIFGTGGPESIDWPGTLVFTTYATLRNYRFSFAGCRWGTAIFDEAQNLKNPNALQTVAAKALNAGFRILLTGTPVENHLGDLWSLMDLAEPSFLDSFQNFRRAYVAPILADRSRVVEIGRSLRHRVGNLMLRRLKDQELQGLPKKTTILHTDTNRQEFDERIVAVMRGRQKELYDSILESARSAGHAFDHDSDANNWLTKLWNIREVVLHPALLNDGRIPVGANRREAERALRESEKLAIVLRLLEDIHAKGEKVLIFATTKRLQEALAANLSRIYEFDVPIINGDAPAGTRSSRPEAFNKTRFGMIERFQAAEGFRICILSPLAAGVGLTITAANHVIHLERSWNPAKEAQATDRVYRIGATKPVFVHIPVLLHPERDSFDVNLDRLLRSKVQLQDAITLAAPEEVETGELLESLFKDLR